MMNEMKKILKDAYKVAEALRRDLEEGARVKVLDVQYEDGRPVFWCVAQDSTGHAWCESYAITRAEARNGIFNPVSGEEWDKWQWC